MNHYTIARPYAKAVFNQAVNDERLEPWSVALQVLAQITSDFKLVSLISNPKITDEVIKTLIYQTLQESVQEIVMVLGKQLECFLSLLLEKKRLLTVADIYLLYCNLLSDYKKIMEVEVLVAMPLSEEQQQRFCKSLQKRFACKVSIRFRQDQSLIGGALVRSGNWVLDGSIRGKIACLGDVLMS